MDIGLVEIVILTTLAAAGVYVYSRPPYTLATVIIVLSIVINLAGYSFLTYDVAGAKRELPGATIFTYIGPLMLFATIAVVASRLGTPLFSFLKRNLDVLLLVGSAVLSTLFAFDLVRAAQYSLWLASAAVVALMYFYLLGQRFPTDAWGAELAGILFIGNAPFMLLVVSGAANFDGRVDTMYSAKLFWTYAASIIVPAVLVLGRKVHPWAGLKLLRKIPFGVLLSIALFSAGVLLLSGKRNPIISTALVLLLYVMLGTRSQLKAGVASTSRLLIIVVGLGLVSWQLSPLADRTWDRFEKMTDSSRNTSIQSRQELISSGLSVFEEYPVFGVGLANGAIAIKRLVPGAKSSGMGLHNTLLGVLVETGAIGLFFFIIVAGRTLYLLAKTNNKHFRLDWLLLAIPPALVSLTEYNLTPGQAMFWPLLLSILAPRALLASTRTSRFFVVTHGLSHSPGHPKRISQGVGS